MMLYCFVDEQKAEGFPIERICEIACVSRSAYYDWKKHRCGVETAAELEERDLVADIAKIHKVSGGTYGSPRVTAELHDLGQVVNHKRVERLMRIHNIVGYTPPDKMVTTTPYGLRICGLHRFPSHGRAKQRFRLVQAVSRSSQAEWWSTDTRSVAAHEQPSSSMDGPARRVSIAALLCGSPTMATSVLSSIYPHTASRAGNPPMFPR
jgi:hypothetical protein